ncbi:hypothetical protein D1831_04735 [Lactiplantibacillus garii]|uniref:Helicase Helix-turn-helix domain-containing protein n=1 Tax=Lactiplantibacillus garii TaxID=2306423 RepID=A0A3R8KMB9_9LACO|nr:helix-turn-helix domain-containing protein [Lactiplantibacillus garii]RRK10990.1 hypothetical protein D1831_04735 [Lactiplantibacillus garii]
MFADYILLLFAPTPRRAKGIFNVLRGRRTVSTLFAGLTYGCLDQLDSWHGVPLETFLATTTKLVTAGDLTSPEAGYYQLTAQGMVHQRALKKERYQPVASVTFQTVAVRRFAALSQLALQVVSEAAHHENRYYPVTTDPGVQATVKAWFRRYRGPELAPTIFAALKAFLTTLPDELARIFVQSLTGYQFPGQTDAQLAAQFNREPVELLVIRRDLTCRWIVWLQHHPQDPLWALLAPLVKASPVSDSAQQTLQEFLRGGDLAAIAQRRKLKLSTVREHLLEVAILTPEFPFDQLLSPALITQLTTVFADQPDLTSWRFDQVQRVAPQLDFFYFRLFQIMRCQHD